MSGTAASGAAQPPADTLRFVNPPTLSTPRGYLRRALAAVGASFPAVVRRP